MLMLIWNGLLSAQYLVINNSTSGGINIPFQDTLLSSLDPVWGYCTNLNYNVDLDNYSTNDVDFSLECYVGGMGSYYKMYISTLNNFSVHINTSFEEHFQYIDSLGIHDTTRNTAIIRKYFWADTIYANQNLESTGNYLLYQSYGYYPSCVYNNIDAFLGDTSYIAFTKNDGNTVSLYYLKIYVPSKYKLELISAKTNEQSGDINDNELLSNYIFPNPAKEGIRFKEGYDFVEIYTLQGTLVIKENLSNTQNLFDISQLNRGFYIVNLKKNETNFFNKLMKL